MKSSSPAIRLVIFDWAGTTIDFGSRAPAAAFSGVFAGHGVSVTDAEARRPMGLNKREHLIAMFNNPEVASRWRSVHGREWNEHDVDKMYHEFMPIQLQAIEHHSQLVPGLLDVAKQLRKMQLKIGGTTGYFSEAACRVARAAAEQGFEIDCNICADDVPQGRPAPWMIYRVMERLGIYPPSSVVNVGDTVADIQAGLAAGCWSVGVCDSSSLTGLSWVDFEKLSAADRQSRIRETADQFRQAGCHAVIDSIAELPDLIAKFPW